MDSSPPDPRQADPTLSDWIGALRGADIEAVGALWSRIEPRLRGLARRKLGEAPRRTYDEEDLALSAWNALCEGALAGRFERLHCREDLWRLLATILGRKASNRRRYHHARDELGESVLVGSGLDDIAPASDGESIQALAVECAEMIGRLEPKLREVVLLKLEGFTNEEVAARIGRAPRTVQRYLELVRSEWHD